MSTPKRHHYIPQMLLHRFTDEDGKLYFFDKRSSNGVMRSTPQNIFLERHLYTQYEEHGKKDVSVEMSLAVLEGQANQIIGKIVNAARSGKRPGLTCLEKRTWDKFFRQQWRRLPSMRDRVSDPTLISKVLNNFEDKYQPLTPDERDKFNSPQEQSRLLKNAWVGAIGMPGGELLQVLGEKGLCVAVIQYPKKSFVIGSTPIIKITPPGHTHLADPVVEALFPIAYDVIVTHGLPRGEEKLVNEIDAAHIRQLNEAMFKQSTVIAGNSRKLIKSLSRRYSTYS